MPQLMEFLQRYFTSFQMHKWPQIKMHTNSDIIFGHSFSCSFTRFDLFLFGVLVLQQPTRNFNFGFWSQHSEPKRLYTRVETLQWGHNIILNKGIIKPFQIMKFLAINFFSPDLPTRPIDDTVKFIFNRQI